MPKRGPEAKREDADQVSPLTFEGTSSEECETFVHAVHNFSRSQGRSNDHDWVLDLARASFVGPALRWYTELPKESQANWRALRSALFRHYQADVKVDPEEDDELNPATLPLGDILRDPVEREVVFRGPTSLEGPSARTYMSFQELSRKRKRTTSFELREKVGKKLYLNCLQDPHHPRTTAHLYSQLSLFSVRPQEFNVCLSSNEEWTLDDAQPPPSLTWEGPRSLKRAYWFVEVGPEENSTLDEAHLAATLLCSKAHSTTWLSPMPEQGGTYGTVLACERVPAFVSAVLSFDLFHPSARDGLTERVISLLVGFRHVTLRFARVDTGKDWAQLQIRPDPALTVRVLMEFQAATPEELEQWEEEANLEGEISRWSSVVTGGSEKGMNEEGIRNRHLCDSGMVIEVAAVVFKQVGGGR